MFLGGAFTLERRSGLSRLAGVFLCFLPSAFTIFNGKAKLGDGKRKRLNGEELSHFGSNKQKKVGGAGGRVGSRGESAVDEAHIPAAPAATKQWTKHTF